MGFQLFLEFPDAGLGSEAGLTLIVKLRLGCIELNFGSEASVCLFVIGRDVTLRYRVIPAQLAEFPAQVQVQGIAVAPIPVIVHLYNAYGLVFTVHQPVACQGSRVVVAAGGVKAPVLRHAKSGVSLRLVFVVVGGGALRGDLQDEIRWLPLSSKAKHRRAMAASRSTSKAIRRSGYSCPVRWLKVRTMGISHMTRASPVVP